MNFLLNYKKEAVHCHQESKTWKKVSHKMVQDGIIHSSITNNTTCYNGRALYVYRNWWIDRTYNLSKFKRYFEDVRQKGLLNVTSLFTDIPIILALECIKKDGLDWRNIHHSQNLPFWKELKYLCLGTPFFINNNECYSLILEQKWDLRFSPKWQTFKWKN